MKVTAHPTAAWTCQQLREAWPWDTGPRFVIRDRDTIYGAEPQRAAEAMGIAEVLTAPRSPWQRRTHLSLGEGAPSRGLPNGQRGSEVAS